MRKNYFLYIFLFVFLIAVFGCKTGNNKKENINTEELTQEYFFPEEVYYNQSVGEVIADRFYPIGWSKNGNFAYLIEPADEGLGNYMLGVVVISLVSNEVLWDWYTDPVVEEDLYREDIWKKHYDEFKEKLNKFGIIQIRNIKLEEDYFVYNGNDFILNLETKKEPDDYMGLETVRENKIVLKSKQLGQKTVAEDVFEQSMILGQQIAGCFISPYEERIAILVRSERWGYEGPPNVVEYKIYGSNLSTGFQK